MNPLAEIIPFPPRFANPKELERHERAIREMQEHDARVKRAEAMRAFESALPRAYRDARLDAPWLRDLVGQGAIERARRALRAHRVVLSGPTAAGKSSLMVAMLRARGEYSARFVHTARLGTARLQHAAGDGEAQYVEIALRAPLIVLDDLGEEAMTAMSAVPDVLSMRYADDLPMWVTTGQSSQALAERYGDGRVRKLFEKAVFIHLGPGEAR